MEVWKQADWSAAPFLPPVYFLKFTGEMMKRSMTMKFNKQILFLAQFCFPKWKKFLKLLLHVDGHTA